MRCPHKVYRNKRHRLLDIDNLHKICVRLLAVVRLLAAAGFEGFLTFATFGDSHLISSFSHSVEIAVCAHESFSTSHIYLNQEEPLIIRHPFCQIRYSHMLYVSILLYLFHKYMLGHYYRTTKYI